VLAGAPPASTEPFVLAGGLNDREHKGHQCWRFLKQPASTKVICAEGCLGRPPQKAFFPFPIKFPIIVFYLYIICHFRLLFVFGRYIRPYFFHIGICMPNSL
jgi:hypothetical protein